MRTGANIGAGDTSLVGEGHAAIGICRRAHHMSFGYGVASQCAWGVGKALSWRSSDNGPSWIRVRTINRPVHSWRSRQIVGYDQASRCDRGDVIQHHGEPDLAADRDGCGVSSLGDDNIRAGEGSNFICTDVWARAAGVVVKVVQNTRNKQGCADARTGSGDVQINRRCGSVRINELRIGRDAIRILTGRELPVTQGELVTTKASDETTDTRGIEIVVIGGESTESAYSDRIMFTGADSVAAGVFEDITDVIPRARSHVTNEGKGGVIAINRRAADVNAVEVDVVYTCEFKHSVDLVSSRDRGSCSVDSESDHVVLVSALAGHWKNTNQLRGRRG